MVKKLLTSTLVILGAGGAYAYFEHHDPPAVEVAQSMVTRGDVVETVVSTGTIDAVRTVQVGSQVSGTVVELDADYNSIVKQGEVIARLDPSLFQAQVDVQQANRDRQQNEILNAQLQLDNAEINLARARKLFADQLIAQQDLEQAELTEKADAAAVESNKKLLVQAEANLNQAKLNLSYCTIRAPIDGVVVQRLVDVGQTVQSSMNTPQFFELAAGLDHLTLTAAVDESDIGKIQPGQDVSFTVDAYHGSTFHGAVRSVRLNSVTTNNVVTYQTVVDVQNPDLRLRPGMTANLQITVNSVRDTLRVPNTALRFRPTAEMYTALGLTPPAEASTPIRAAAAATAAAPVRAPATTPEPPKRRATADRIDELFTPFHEPPVRGRVWTWNPDTKQLTAVDVVVGISDGQQTALLTGALTPGQHIVTSIVLPAAPTTRPGPNPLMSPPRGMYRRF